jgi:hypothetical protein
MKVVVCRHCRTSVAPRTDGTCPACTSPVDGSAPAQPRTVELGRPDDAGAAARRSDVRHLLLGIALLVGGAAGLWLSWVMLSGDGNLWKPVVIVAVAMLFRGVWEWWEVDRRLGKSLVLGLAAAGLGLPAGRGRFFFPIAAAAAVYAAHRLRTVVLRRRDAVPAARVHADDDR